MMGLLTVARNFLSLAVILQLGLSSAEDAKAVEISQLVAEKIYNETVADFKNLKTRYLTRETEIEKLSSQSPPNPVPNLLEKINDYPAIKSLRASLNETWPKVWLIPRRKTCAKVLDDKIQTYVKDRYTQEVQDNFDSLINIMKAYILGGNSRRIQGIEEGLQKFKSVYMEACVKDNKCEMKDQDWKRVVEDLNELEEILKNWEEKFKENLDQLVNNRVHKMIIPDVEKCLNE